MTTKQIALLSGKAGIYHAAILLENELVDDHARVKQSICPQGAVYLKELFICNIRLIRQRNIVCKATLLHELPVIKLFRTDQGHSSHLHFAYFDHVFLPRPLITFHLFLLLAFMLCNMYTEEISDLK